MWHKGEYMESNFQFVKPYLQRLDYKVNETFVDTDGDVVQMENKFDIGVERINHSRAKVTLKVLVEGKETGPFSINSEIASEFEWDDIEEEHLEKLLTLNAPSLLLGFLRPIIANLTGQSMYETYYLPYINLTKVNVKE